MPIRRRLIIAAAFLATMLLVYVAIFAFTIRLGVLDYFGTSSIPNPPDFALAYSEDVQSNARARQAFAPLIYLLEASGKFIWDDSGEAAGGWLFADRILWGLVKEHPAIAWSLLVAAIAIAVWAFRRRKHPCGCCTRCGYDLRGSPSGICPECGTSNPPLQLTTETQNGE